MRKRRVTFKEIFKKKEIRPDMIGNVKLEKNDVLAMAIAAVTVFLPAVLLIFGGLAVLILVLFYRG